MRARAALCLTAVLALAGCSSAQHGGNVVRGNRVAPSPTNVARTVAPTTSTTRSTSTSPARSVGVEPCTGSAPPARFDHVVWIVMENHGLGQIDGSPAAPYLNRLGRACGVATDYSGVAHPSLPNYIALTSGSTDGISDDSGPSSHPVAGPSLFSLLGSGWRSLEEGMPTNCDRGTSGEYAVKHNPAAYYTSIAVPCQTQDVPLGARPDLSARFTFITPDLCHDMHDCPIGKGDSWLSQEVPEILTSPEYQAGATALFITWDEDESGGTLVPTYVIAPSVVPATRSAAPLDHYSLLRTTEELLGLTPLLGRAAGAASMTVPFHL